VVEEKTMVKKREVKMDTVSMDEVDVRKPVNKVHIEEAPSIFGMDMTSAFIPDEDVQDTEVEDAFAVQPAVKYAFIGVGQGGSRIIESFYNIGYRRCCVVNTAKQDLDEIHLDDDRKLWLGVGGAAKNRAWGRDYIEKNSEQVMDLMRRSYGTKFDRVMVCATAGGGTGSGGFGPCIEIANELVESLRIKKVGDKTKVGLIVALPSNSERDRMDNAFESLREVERRLNNKEISPVLIADNELIRNVHPSATLGNVRQKVNHSVTSLFHIFNQISKVPSHLTSFDPADYATILDSGLVTFGAMQIEKTAPEDISAAFRDNFTKSVLSDGVDLTTAKVVACLLVGSSAVLENIPWKTVEHAYEMLGRVLKTDMIHRGEYVNNQPLFAYTAIGGLAMPTERINEIARIIGKTDFDE